MPHGHDEHHDHAAPPAPSAGHHDSHHDAAGDSHHDAAHGHHDPAGHGHHAAAPPAPTPAHVFTISRLTRWLGIALCLGALLATGYYKFLAAEHNWSCVAVATFASLYGFCIWRAAADTLAREAGARAGQA